MKTYNNEKYIISITSFPQRYHLCVKTIFNLLKYQTYKNFHLVLTLFKEDYEKLSEELRLFLDNDLIEVIVADENLCPHLKYYCVMQKYKNLPIITLDDDRKYSNNIIEILVRKYESLNYKSIICNVAPRMTKSGNHLNDAAKWCVGETRLRPNEKSYVAMAEGFGGVLYPPNCFEKFASILEIKNILFHDDLYLKVLAIRNKVPVTQANSVWNYNVFGFDFIGANETSLYNHNHTNFDYRRKVTQLFENDLLAGFKL